ncbi:MAG: peptidylprolyl isomerase [Candidatus Handelsmanbacteria bacterium]|nr:peptidylprolyl isomerase [Candidatus Handelsmanbacteria bacterium]
MMTTLRQNTAIVLWIVIFAFIALIVVEWGADFSQTSQAKAGETVGTVNGRAIGLEEFRQALRNAARMEQSQGRKVQDDQLVGEVWDGLIRELLAAQEIERLGIAVSDQELAFYTRNQPPREVQAITAFQTEGKFDFDKYTQFINDPQTYAEPANKSFVLQVENLIHNQLLNYKLQRLVSEGVQASPAEVRQFFLDHNEKVKVEYVFSPGNKLKDSEMSVVPADLQAYYQEHQSEFQHGDQVRLAYVVLPRLPSAADSLRLAQDAAQLRQEILEGADFAELAKSMSEDPGSASAGGDLGPFTRGRMVKPFEEAAFALKPGEVSEPVLTPFGLHLIKVENRGIDQQGQEQVQARHILLKFAPSGETEDALRARIEALREAAGAKGIETAAQEAGLEVRDSGFVGRGRQVPGLGEGSAWLVNLFLQHSAGELGQGANEQFFWLAQSKESRPKGTASLDDVRQQVERAVLNQKKAERAGQLLQGLRGQANWVQVAAGLGLEARTTEPFARADQVPGVGRNNAFTRAAFRLQPGEVSEVVTLPRGAYLLRLVEKVPADESQFQATVVQLAEQVLRQRQNEALQIWFDRLYANAQIEDNRHHFGFTF